MPDNQTKNHEVGREYHSNLRIGQASLLVFLFV